MKKNTITKDITKLIQEIKNFSENNNFDFTKKLEYISDKVENKIFNVTVLGEFNRGKSTFINSLIGENILPIGITPTTANIFILTYSPEPYAKVIFSNGKEKILKDFSHDILTNLNIEFKEEIKEVIIGHPSEILKNIEIVDTPGVNDLNEQKLQVTYEFIPKSDAVIFILDCEQLLSKSESLFLESKLLINDINKILFIANKCDELENKNDINQVLDYAEEKLSKYVNNPLVINYSSKKALQAKKDNDKKLLKDSNYQNLIDSFNTNIIEKQETIFLENIINGIQNISNVIVKKLKLKKELQLKEIGELEKIIKHIEENEDSINEKVIKIQENNIRKIDDLKNIEVAELREFGLNFTNTINNEINDISYKDLKTYFPLFVQDKFKEWFEYRENEINYRLMIILKDSVEEIEEIFSELKKDLSIKLDFDSVKLKSPQKSYGLDIGTSALVTIGFFVMFAGNLLTFIAGSLLVVGGGALAVFFKDKREEDYKDEFKKYTKTCILKTTNKVEPKLIEIIDSTSEKLNNYVKEIFDTELETIKKTINATIEEKENMSESLDFIENKINESEKFIEKIGEKLDILKYNITNSQFSTFLNTK